MASTVLPAILIYAFFYVSSGENKMRGQERRLSGLWDSHLLSEDLQTVYDRQLFSVLWILLASMVKTVKRLYLAPYNLLI